MKVFVNNNKCHWTDEIIEGLLFNEVLTIEDISILEDKVFLRLDYNRLYCIHSAHGDFIGCFLGEESGEDVIVYNAEMYNIKELYHPTDGSSVIPAELMRQALKTGDCISIFDSGYYISHLAKPEI